MYRGWWIVLCSFFSQFTTTGSSGWVFGVLLLPMQEDLGASRSAIVGVLVVERLMGGAAGTLIGPFVDRNGARLVMTVSAMVAGTCLFGLALVQTAWQPYILWAIFGLALPGLSTVAPVAAISSWFVRKRTRAIVTYTFGGALAGLILAPIMAIVASELSWRAVWVVMGVLFWLIAPLAWTIVRRTPEEVGLQPDGLNEPPAATSRDVTEAPADDWTVAEALRSRSFWLITAGFTLTMLPASSIFIHMSSYVQSKGFSTEEGAAAVSIYGFGAVMGRFVWGFMVGRFAMRRSLVAWALLYGVSIVLYALPNDLVTIYATTIFLGVAVSGSLQFRAQAFPDYFGRRIVGTLIGYSSAIGTLAAAVAPLMVAFAFDASGSYAGIFIAFGVCCMAASIGFVFSAPRRAPRPQPA